MNKIIDFPPSDTFTPECALLSALDFARNDDLTDVLIVGYDGDGKLLIRSSRMNNKEALWIAEQLRMHILNI